MCACACACVCVCVISVYDFATVTSCVKLKKYIVVYIIHKMTLILNEE